MAGRMDSDLNHTIKIKNFMDLVQLPPELWKEIVEISALSSLHQATQLAQVSKPFYDWTQPVLLRTAVHYSESSGWPQTTVKLSWFQQNGSHLRNLLWGMGNQMNLLVSILECCPSLENLAVWVHAPSSELHVIRPALSKLSLRELSINPFFLFSNDIFGFEQAEDPMFERVTHFHLINDSEPLEWERVQGLANIPSLTHIVLHYKTMKSAADGLLERCQNLQVLIVLLLSVGYPSDWERPTGDQDPDHRLIFPSLRTIEDWQAGAMGGMDCWRSAEEEIANRKIRGWKWDVVEPVEEEVEDQIQNEEVDESQPEWAYPDISELALHDN